MASFNEKTHVSRNEARNSAEWFASKTPRLILASASPRRRQLLEEYGYEPEVITPVHAEPDRPPVAVDPAAWAEALSHYKAKSVAEALGQEIFDSPESDFEPSRQNSISVDEASLSGSGRSACSVTHRNESAPGTDLSRGIVILAADTLTVCEDRIIGKAADRRHAAEILQTLSGTTHRVITGVTLLRPDNGDRRIRHDATDVTFRRLTDGEIEAYLDSGEWVGKAGAYGIQDSADEFVERIDGSFTNVVGLPMELVCTMLAEFGVRQRPRSCDR